jgi:anti-anti-sigma factor
LSNDKYRRGIGLRGRSLEGGGAVLERPRALPPLEINVSTGPDRVRVAVVGEIDLCTSPMLWQTFEKILSDGGPTRVDLDLSGLTFLDASGISAILRARHRAEGAGGRLVLLRPRSFIRRVLDLTGVSDLCEIDG